MYINFRRAISSSDVELFIMRKDRGSERELFVCVILIEKNVNIEKPRPFFCRSHNSSIFHSNRPHFVIKQRREKKKYLKSLRIVESDSYLNTPQSYEKKGHLKALCHFNKLSLSSSSFVVAARF